MRQNVRQFSLFQAKESTNKGQVNASLLVILKKSALIYIQLWFWKIKELIVIYYSTSQKIKDLWKNIHKTIYSLENQRDQSKNLT